MEVTIGKLGEKSSRSAKNEGMRRKFKDSRLSISVLTATCVFYMNRSSS